MQLVNSAVLDALFWLAVAGCAVAQFFILRTAFRPLGGDTSGPDGAAEPSMMVPSSRRPMEIMWAVLPVLLLGAAFYLAWQTLHPTPVSVPT